MSRLQLFRLLAYICVVLYACSSTSLIAGTNGQNDTLRIMDYNILDYPGSDYATRDPWFRKVVQSAMPDVLVVEEMTSQTGVNTFLNDVLNYSNAGLYSTIPFHDGPDTDPQIYFKTTKVTFLNANYIPTDLRDIGEYVIRVNSSSDTLHIFSVHLKADQGSTYEAARLTEATTLRNYLSGLPAGTKFMVMGDFNFYTSSESGFQKLTDSEANNSGRLKDPINQVGSWHDNAAYALYHTQSPRTRSFGGGSTGGMDDRFDFILTSYSSLDNNTITSSYKAYGNDGNHLNDSINRLPNTAVPDSVANGLEYSSDHIPVICDFKFSAASLPASFVQLSPANGASNQPTSGTLRWQTSGSSTSYDVYLGTSNPPTTKVGSDQTDTTYSYAGLTNGTTYYWKVTAKNSNGSTDATGSPWNFTTIVGAPGAFSFSSPSNGAVNQPLSGSLTWQSSAGATGYDVYLSNTNPPVTMVSSNQPGTSYSYSGLINSTLYYWKIVARNSADTMVATGAPWNFATVPAAPNAFNLSTPSNGATNQAVSGTLTWSTSTGATGYDVYLDGNNPPATVVSSNQTGTSYAYSALSNNATYYWKVIAKNAGGSTTATGVPWSFAIVPAAPNAFNLLTPSNGATNQAVSGTLTWSTSIGATGYDVYLDGNNPPITVVSSNQAGTSYAYSALSNNATYYWKVVAKNAGGSTTATGVPWSFAIVPAAPNAFNLLTPSNGATNQAVSGTLTWSTSTGATGYDVYLDGNNPPVTLVSSNQAGTSYAYSALSNNATYYWKVVAKNAGGSTTAIGAPWSFVIVPAAPNAFNLLTPSNVATNQAVSGTLTWSTSTGATGYDVYLDGNNPPITVVSSNQAGTSYAYSILSNNATYYWKVVANNTGGSTMATGAPWSFTTVVVPPGIPTLSSPTDGALNQPTTLILSWNSISGATSYRLQVSQYSSFTPTVYDQNSITVISQQVSGLAASTTYYWRVSATNAGGTSAYSIPWSFTTVATPPPTPGAFNLLTPSNASAGQASSGTLSWESASNATGYDVYLDQNNPPTTVVSSNQGVTSYPYNGLANGSTYYWKVIANNATGNTTATGAPWSFSTVPAAPSAFNLLTPSNNAANQALSGTLSWTTSTGATGYDVYLDENNPPVTLVSSNQAGTSYAYSALSNSATFYWKVVAKNAVGSTTATGAPWSFSTLPPAPGAFNLLTPSNGSSNQAVSGKLTWQSSTGATGYDVYLDGNNPPTTIVSSNQSGTTYSYSGLFNDSMYYWKIIARNVTGNTTATGVPWNFITVPPIPSTFQLLLPTDGALEQLTTGTLKWSSSANATGYDIYLDTSALLAVRKDSNLTDTSYVYTRAVPGEVYFWKVEAKNSAGTIVAANAPRSFTIANVPTAPSNFVASGLTTTSLHLSWDGVTDENGYRIYRSNGGPFSQAGSDLPSNTTSFDDTGLQVNQKYVYRVTAFNLLGEGNYRELTIGTLSATPGFPALSGVGYTSLMLTLDPAGNPSGTQFAIEVIDDSTKWFVQINGTLDSSPAWQTFAQWGGSSGTNVSHLKTCRSYDVAAKARNVDTIETSYGGKSTQTLSCFTFTSVVEDGWNLISLPVRLENDPIAEAFPRCISEAYTFESAYIVNDSMHHGVGYWLRFRGVDSSVFAAEPILDDSIPVRSGWNMIGSISSPVPVNTILSYPAGVVTSRFFGYLDGYLIADTIMPGHGYWVKSDTDGYLILTSHLFANSANHIRIVPTGELPPSPPTGHAQSSLEVPKVYTLEQAYPNPFNPSTTIRYQLPSDSRVSLKVYNLLGQVVATLINQTEKSGYQQVEWNASSFASGIYFYRIEATSVVNPSNSYTQVRKIVLLK